MEAFFSLTGNKALDAKFLSLPLKVRKKILRTSLRPPMKPMHAAARAGAPVRTGRTRRSVKLKAQKRTRKGKIGLNLLTTEKHDPYFKEHMFYPHLVEKGYRRGRRTAGIRSKAVADTRQVVEGRHFIRRAFERHAPGAMREIQRSIRKLIEAEAG